MSLAYHARYLCSNCDKYHKPGSNPFRKCEAIMEARRLAQAKADATGKKASVRVGGLTVIRSPSAPEADKGET